MSALSSSRPAVRSFSLWQVTQYLVITACGSVGGPWAADASTEATKNKAHTEASRAFRIFAENNKSEAAIVSRLKGQRPIVGIPTSLLSSETNRLYVPQSQTATFYPRLDTG